MGLKFLFYSFSVWNLGPLGYGSPFRFDENWPSFGAKIGSKREVKRASQGHSRLTIPGTSRLRGFKLGSTFNVQYSTLNYSLLCRSCFSRLLCRNPSELHETRVIVSGIRATPSGREWLAPLLSDDPATDSILLGHSTVKEKWIGRWKNRTSSSLRLDFEERWVAISFCSCMQVYLCLPFHFKSSHRALISWLKTSADRSSFPFLSKGKGRRTSASFESLKLRKPSVSWPIDEIFELISSLELSFSPFTTSAFEFHCIRIPYV